MKTLKDLIPELPENNLLKLYKDWWKVAKTGHIRESTPLHVKFKEEKKRVVSLLPDLHKLKMTIDGRYSDFELLSYHFDIFPENKETEFLIAYRPKGANVSFWTARLEDCVISK